MSSDLFSIYHLDRAEPDPEFQSLLKLRDALPNPGSEEIYKQFGIELPKKATQRPDIWKLDTKLPFEKSRKEIKKLRKDLTGFDTRHRNIKLNNEYNCYYKFPNSERKERISCTLGELIEKAIKAPYPTSLDGGNLFFEKTKRQNTITVNVFEKSGEEWVKVPVPFYITSDKLPSEITRNELSTIYHQALTYIGENIGKIENSGLKIIPDDYDMTITIHIEWSSSE